MEQAQNKSAEETVQQEETVEQTAQPVQDDVENQNDENNVELSEEELKIHQLEEQVADLTNRLLRAQADYDNFRRRSREEKEAAAKYRVQSLVEGLLPVLDNFERALLVQPESEETKSLLQGMEMVHRQLQDALVNEGVQVIETVGQSFDPHLHQAIMQVEDSNFEKNSVVEELQKGYKLKDRVIRPAMVKVNG